MPQNLLELREQYVEEAEELLFGVAMTGFAGVTTDRGGKDYYLDQLAIYSECVAWLKRAAALQTKPLVREPKVWFDVYSSIGRALRGLEKYTEAIEYFRKAESFLAGDDLFAGEEATEAEKKEAIAVLEMLYVSDFADCYLSIGENDKALRYYQKYLLLCESDSQDEVPDCLIKIGKLFRKMDKELDAIESFTKVKQNKTSSGLKRAYANHLIAESYKLDDKVSLEQATFLYEEAFSELDGYFEVIRPRGGGSALYSPYPEHEQANDAVGEADWDPLSTLSVNVDAIVVGAVAVNISLAARHSQPEKNIQTAFIYSEQFRAIGLSMLMKLICKFKDMRYVMGHRVTAYPDDKTIDREHAKDIISRLLDEISLPIISYRLAEDQLYIFLHLPSAPVQVFTVQVSQKYFHDLVTGFRHQINRKGALRGGSFNLRGLGVEEESIFYEDKNYAQLIGEILFPKELFSLLINFQEIILIPHSFIGLIPLAAVSINDKLLVDCLSIRIVPSIMTLYEIEKRDYLSSENLSNSVVLASAESKTLLLEEGIPIHVLPLTGALKEGQSVAKLLGVSLITEESEEVKKLLDNNWPKAAVIHLATHGFAKTEIGRDYYSFMMLCSGHFKSQMTVRYIINNETPFLQANLVVLSGCETGVGATTGSEGVLGLQRAFLAKGAKTVIATLWSVSDEASYFLMDSFYKHWLGGNEKTGKAEALRLAQLETRARYPDPFYWAGVQINGGN